MIRHWLIEQRKSMAMTQMAIAEKAGISRAYYTQLERGQRTPSIRIARQLAGIMGIEWVRFFDDDGAVRRTLSETQGTQGARRRFADKAGPAAVMK